MNGRRFLLTSVAGVLAAPLAGEAQQAGKVWRAGFLGTLSASDYAVFLKAFRQGLRDLEYEELAARERGAALL